MKQMKYLLIWSCGKCSSTQQYKKILCISSNDEAKFTIIYWYLFLSKKAAAYWLTEDWI